MYKGSKVEEGKDMDKVQKETILESGKRRVRQKYTKTEGLQSQGRQGQGERVQGGQPGEREV